MRKLKLQKLLGTLLIISGGLLLLQKFNYLQGNFGNIFLALSFGFTGYIFFRFYITHRSQWWSMLISLIMFSLAITNILSLIQPDLSNLYNLSVSYFVVGLGFLLIYISNRLHWWAVIPSGLLFTLGAISLVENSPPPGIETGGVLFLGLGITFLLLSFLPTPYGRVRWALYPALPLLLIGTFLTFEQTSSYLDYTWPAIIILAGLYFLWGAFRRK
ncbi:MAG: hypothetical protein OEZ02_10005 [Anaerolineae bacterium]|nr:hypothetical protein [Anaerolineae bacterium]